MGWRARLEAARKDERGYTLIELIVSMGIFSVFIVMFLSAVTGLMREATETQVRSESTSGALIVFQEMDRQIRYADAINYPGTGASGARYIEFRTPASSSLSGDTMCTQWRFTPSKNLIESREWKDVVGNVPTPWETKLTAAISDTDPNYPFSLTPARLDGSAMQQLKLVLDAGTDGVDGSTEVSTSFVARNSSILSQSNADSNNDLISDTPVCLTTGTRP